jgi:GxxExxY protein
LLNVSQKFVPIEYKGFTREEPLRFDLLVEGCVFVEAKAADKILPIHKAQLFELHETPQCSRRTTHQFPREKSH